MEVANVKEELQVAKLDLQKNVELVRGLAWEEINSHGATRSRMEARIRRENPAMTNELIALSVTQAETGSGEPIAQLDVGVVSSSL